MKNLYKIFIILSILLLSGCGKNISLNINSNSITSILYDGINIASSDFEDITSKINENIFKDLYNIDTKGKNLIITTTEYTYNFQVFDNFVTYTVDNKKYYTRIDKFNNYLKDITNKYKDVFKIEKTTNYDIENSDYLIKLDDSKYYIILNTLSNIYNFEVTTNNYASLTKNKIAKIENNKVICIETDNIDDINISFENPYKDKINITYNNGFITNVAKVN